jgi:vacuolar-type H+-ATPase subunit E/Vma4
MEELQSTEVLDREILEDARRKAFRILKSADDTVKSNALTWEKKTTKAVADLKRRFGDRRDKSSEEIMARLPLDKRRAESERIERLVSEALDLWYGAQSRERILGLLEAELRRRLEDCPEFADAGASAAVPSAAAAAIASPAAASPRPIRAMFYKLGREEGETLLAKVLPPGSWETVDYRLGVEGAASASSTGAGAAIRASGVLSGKYPELVLDSPGLRITASVNMLAAALFADYRLELTAALIGENHRILTGGPQ